MHSLVPHSNNYKPFFKASVNSGTLEMMIYTEIGETWDGTGITAAGVKAKMDAAPFDKIVMRINSPGGDCFEGCAIGNLIKSCGKPVDVFIDGVAASSASIIAMAGTTITMGNNALIMIHNAWSVAMGDAKDMRKMADTLDTVSAAIAQTYVDKTGLSMKDIQAMMDEETWINASDAVAKGFATQIAEQPAVKPTNAFQKAFKAYKNVPASLRNEPEPDPNDPNEPTEPTEPTTCQCECGACPDACDCCVNADCKDPHCKDCAEQSGKHAAMLDMEGFTDNDNNLSLYEAQLALLRLTDGD